jgi:hypothetical protein
MAASSAESASSAVGVIVVALAEAEGSAALSLSRLVQAVKSRPVANRALMAVRVRMVPPRVVRVEVGIMRAVMAARGPCVRAVTPIE